MHTIDYNFSLLAPLGIVGSPPPLHLDLPPAAVESANKLLEQANLKRPLILFHPTSARTEKFWEPDRWAQVIEHVRTTHDVDLALTGGSSVVEQEQIRRIHAALRQPIVDLSGKTDLLGLMGLISRAELLVTVDSAPMHLAAAVQVPQVVLFGPTNPFHWRPRETPAVVLQGESNEPVRQFSADQPRLPMKLISTQAVINGMNALLSTPAAGA
jgi:ADP-heptose:LPS heptosyltransferase